jgi:hypothetical protein
MAIVSRNPQDGQDDDGGAAPAAARHNLPLKAAPVVGRRAEMQRVVSIFERIRRESGRPRRVEVVGRQGVGASTVAVELARRAGHRFPGGAWYLNASIGPDLAWAGLGAVRGSGPVKDLAVAAAKARERLGEEPKALLVIDGLSSAAQAQAALPPAGEAAADVFLVAEAPLGTVDADQVCEVSPVPPQGASRIAHAMLRASQPEAKPPAVRTTDGLAVTASLAARAALAFQGREGPLLIDAPASAMQRIVRLVARHPTALELLLLAAVAHPLGLPVESLLAALRHVRAGRGNPPTDEDASAGVIWLAHAGVLEPLDEAHFSMHPILQEVVRGMASSAADLQVAREALAQGLVQEAEASVTAEGVDIRRAALHQLRHLAATTEGDLKAKLAAAVAKVEEALGLGGAAPAAAM